MTIVGKLNILLTVHMTSSNLLYFKVIVCQRFVENPEERFIISVVV